MTSPDPIPITDLVRIEADLRPDRLPTRLDSSAAWLIANGVQVEAPPAGLPGRFYETGYLLPNDLPIEEWLRIGAALQQHENAVGWWLGDWWAYGKGLSRGGTLRRPYGEMASQAAKDHVQDATGHAYTTVRNASHTAEQFEFARRRANLPFAHHTEVAPLPAANADALLDGAEADGWNRQTIRDEARHVKQALAAEARAALPAPTTLPTDITLLVGDALALDIPDGTVDLVLTSPPYALDKPYGADKADIAPAQWRAFMTDWLTEAFRVAAPGGRLALNVPLDTTSGGFRPTYAQAVAAAQRAGWTYRTTVIWHDDQLGKSTARGSVASASSPHIIAPVETIALFSKGPWGRVVLADRPSDLPHEDWLAWTNGFWAFPGESTPWEAHPAPFPTELVRRVLLLLSFPGDLVLDPFVGSGTTTLVCSRLGRRCIGVDKDPEYVKSAGRRLAGRGSLS